MLCRKGRIHLSHYLPRADINSPPFSRRPDRPQKVLNIVLQLQLKKAALEPRLACPQYSTLSTSMRETEAQNGREIQLRPSSNPSSKPRFPLAVRGSLPPSLSPRRKGRLTKLLSLGVVLRITRGCALSTAHPRGNLHKALLLLRYQFSEKEVKAVRAGFQGEEMQ